MTAQELAEATGDLYLALIRPRLDDADFQSSLDTLRAVRPSCDSALALQLIATRSWRDRLLGFALAALLKDHSLSEGVTDVFAHPTGISIVPAGAYLVAHYETSPHAFPAIDFTRFDRDSFDGEVGWTVDRVQQAIAGNRLCWNELAPNYGQNMGDHVKLFRALMAA